jgi:hypothetical protein
MLTRTDKTIACIVALLMVKFEIILWAFKGTTVMLCHVGGLALGFALCALIERWSK